MQNVNERKITIRIPTFSWRSLLSIRFFFILTALLFSSGFAYWYHHVRPFLWIGNAHVDAFSTTIHSDVSGRIFEMAVQEGAFVRKGEVLFSIDREMILTRYSKIKSLIESLNSEIESEKGRIGEAMDAYLAATTEAELGIGSFESIQKYLGLMEEAQAKVDETSSKLAKMKSDLNLLEEEMNNTGFIAPFDGVILKQYKTEGTVLSFGDSVCTLCDTNRIWIETEVLETEIGKIKLGTPARIWLTAYPKKEWAGQVSYIGPATVAKTDLLPFAKDQTSIPIKISVERADISMKPGLSAKVALKVR